MVKIEQLNYSFSKVTSNDREEILKIFNYFSYFTEGYQYQPLYKQGRWDGKIKLFKFVEKLLPNGLVYQLKELLESLEIEYEYIPMNEEPFIFTKNDLDDFIKTLNLPSHIEIREYQKELIYQAITKKQLVGVSSTSSGKSLAIYVIVRWMLATNKKSFIIVPSVSLVHQMSSDFLSYGMNEEDHTKWIHCIYSGQEKTFTKPIILTTWQSVFKSSVLDQYTKNINGTDRQYDCVIVDEAHKAKAGDGIKISSILEAFDHSPWKIGVTGSLPSLELLKQQVIACLGEPINIIKASELVDMGYATELDVKVVFLEYNDIDRKYIRSSAVKKNWNLEMDFINESSGKLQFITKLVMSKLKKNENTIVFFKRRKFGKLLYDTLSQLSEKVFYVDGDVNGIKREGIRNFMETENGLILVASYGTFSTGINIKLIHNGLFAENPGKSDITLIQSLGRFLRQHANKTKANIYDIVDDFTYKTYENFAYRHFKERLLTYRNEGWFLDEHRYQIK